MKKSQLAMLNDDDRLLILETSEESMKDLNEDQVADLHRLIRKARNKYSGKYRRRAAQNVSKTGGRGKGFKKNQRARDKAEIFEDALSRVSDQLSVLARQSAEDLKQERLAAARAAKSGQKPGAGMPEPKGSKGNGSGNRGGVKNTRTERRRADTQAQGSRRQAKRDST